MWSVVAWPTVVLILGLVALFLFKKPLSNFLERAEEIGKTGIKASSQKQPTGGELKASQAEELLKQFDNALLLVRESFIHAELEKNAVHDPNERERVLIRFLAGTSLALNFEQTYTRIWGSQIAALQFINELGGNGVEAQALRPWYDKAAAQWPQFYKGYPFEEWLAFLERQRLITRNGNSIAIGLEGREFIKFIVHQGYTFYKQG